MKRCTWSYIIVRLTMVFWVDEMREQYYGVEGEGIFENDAKIMFTSNQISMIAT